jgi:hypothetical protein
MAGENETGRKSNLKLEGEGSYEGARAFIKEQHAFAKSGRVDAKAREAADALDGPEGAALESARKATAKGAKASRKQK